MISTNQKMFCESILLDTVEIWIKTLKDIKSKRNVSDICLTTSDFCLMFDLWTNESYFLSTYGIVKTVSVIKHEIHWSNNRNEYLHESKFW